MKYRKILIGTALATVLFSIAVEAKTVRIRWALWGEPQEIAIWKRWASEFESLNPGVKVSVEASGGDYGQKMLVSTAAGNPPDLVRSNGEYLAEWTAQGILSPLDSYIKSDRSVKPDDWYKTVRSMATYNGKLYGIPSDYSTYMIYYLPAAFAEAGIPAPTSNPDDQSWNWSSMLEAAKKLTTVGPDGRVKRWGFSCDEIERVTSSLIWQNGQRFFTPKADDIAFVTPEASEAITYLTDLVIKHKVMPYPGKAGSYRENFQSRKAAMIMDGNWMKGTFSARKNLEFSGAVMPMKKTRASWVTSSFWSMSPLSKNKQMTWKLISYISSIEKHLEFDAYGQDKGILIPPMRSALSNKKWVPGPVTTAAIRQLEFGQHEIIPRLQTFNNILINAVLKAMEGKNDPRNVLPSIVNPVKTILKRNTKK